MTDPLEALRAPVVPVEPDPIFAARLRERLQRALLQPTGGAMTTTTGQEASAQVRTLTPYLCVDDGRHALRWYAEVFGAEVRVERPRLARPGRRHVRGPHRRKRSRRERVRRARPSVHARAAGRGSAGRPAP